MTRRFRRQWLLAGLMVGLMAGCASQGQSTSRAASSDTDTAAAGDTGTRTAGPVKRSSGPIAANYAIPSDSPLAKIKSGMSEGRVYDLIGQPTEVKTYLTGKQWIPFYFGPDTHRKEALYKGMGRIIFTPSAAFGTGVYKVKEVTYEPNEDGFAD